VKIVYLNPGGTIGGAEMVLLDVLAALPAARPGARPLVLLSDDGPLREAVEALGVACDVVPMPEGVARLGDAGSKGAARALALAARGLAAASGVLAYRSRLARRLRDERPDLVHSNGMKMHLLAAWSAARGVPIVWHLHDYLGSRPAMARLLRLSARRGVGAVAVSDSVADDARATLGDRVPVRAIHNGVDVDRFHPGPGPGDGPALDRAAGLAEAPAGAVRVGLVATFANWKGHELFLDAAARVPADAPARFYVVGGPIYRTAGSQVSMDDLKAQAARLGLGDRVGFTGHQPDPAAALRALDVVVHASTRPEPFGRVIVEGMACGRAVIAMAEGGAAELFIDGRDALGCPPRDPAALAAAMRRLIEDRDLRDRLGRAARASAESRFDRARLADAWASVYDRPSAAGVAAPVPPDPAVVR
jgi:glycosyltransferase involved in cell wall biosynthesis